MGRRINNIVPPQDLAKNQERARRTQDILLQNQSRASQSPVAAQQAGAQAVLGKGAAAIEERAKTAPQVTQAAQAQLQSRGIEQRKQLAEQQRGLQSQARRAEARLFNLDQRVKSQLLDDQLTFKRDELGRTLFNERQLADYALANAKSEEDLRNYAQTVQQVSAKKMMILSAAHEKLKQELTQVYQAEATEENAKLKRELAQAEYNMRMKMAKEQADARNRAGMMGAAGSIIGGVAGAVLAGSVTGGMGAGAGAGVGATIGNGLFTAFGS